MTDFSIKQNDTAPSLEVQLLDAENNQKNIENATNVTFSLYSVRQDENVIVKEGAEIVNVSESKVLYEWQSGDTQYTGHHKGEFEVTYNDSTTETFPNNDMIDIYIEEEIA